MLTDDHQPDLFGAPPAAPPPRIHRCPTCHAGFAPIGTTAQIAAQRAKADHDWAAAWDREVAAHPEDAAAVLAATRALLATRRTVGLAEVWESMRGKVAAIDLSNNYRAPAARRWMAEHPDLAGRIRIRNAAGQVPERAP